VDRPPVRFSPSSRVESSIVARGGRIAGVVQDSVLSPGVVVEAGAVVERSVLMHDVRIGANAKVSEAIVDKQAIIGAEAVIGGQGPPTPNREFPNHLDGGQVLIGKAANVPAGSVVERNAILFPEADLSSRQIKHVSAGETVGDGTSERRKGGT
jgi:glucose-1-phosphate adenylyltransferase